MVVDQNTTQVACKTKYVYLEMILNKDSKYDVISGIFKGITEKNGDKFILLQGLKNSTNVLNIKFYNIMTIEDLEEDYKNMTYLTAEDTDQIIALSTVEKFYHDFLVAGYGLENDSTILDISKFSSIPKEYTEEKAVEKLTNSAFGAGSYVSPSNRYTDHAGTYTKTAVKAEPEPRVLGRSDSKKPSKNTLDIMEDKINQIMLGTFNPILPPTIGEDSDGIGVAETVEDENYYRHFGM